MKLLGAGNIDHAEETAILIQAHDRWREAFSAFQQDIFGNLFLGSGPFQNDDRLECFQLHAGHTAFYTCAVSSFVAGAHVLQRRLSLEHCTSSATYIPAQTK